METTFSQPTIWQPMCIGEDSEEVIPIAVAVPDEHGSYRSLNQPVPSAPFQTFPVPSNPSSLPLYSSTDGSAIVNNDRQAVMASTIAGLQTSARIEQRILQSNFDNIIDLTVDPDAIRLDPNNLKQQNPIVTIEEQRIAEKIRQETTLNASRGGYHISEYKSMYESTSDGANCGGYQISEYKSMYDP